MILYTMMPHEAVFPSPEELELPKQMLVSYQGIPLMVEQTEDYSFRVIRVVSTDPQHFLNTDFSPGTKITF